MSRVRLIFDVCCVGFARRYRRVLEAKGIEVIEAPRWAVRNDQVLREYADRLGAIVVTADKHFPGSKIVLPMDFGGGRKKPKYERWHTFLMRELHRRLGGDEHLAPCHAEHTC